MKKWLSIILCISFVLLMSVSAGAGFFSDVLSGFAQDVFSRAAGVDSVFEHSQRMANLNLSKDGDGYYVFGKHARGGRHWNRMNFWYPEKSYHHEMTTSLEGNHISLDRLIADLQQEKDANGDIQIAFWWDHQDALLANCLREFVSAVGTENFAISMVYSTSSHNISFYVNVDSNASYETIHNTRLIRILKDNIRRVLAADPDAYPKQGPEIRDHFTVSWGKPLLVAYLLGTGDLYFH